MTGRFVVGLVGERGAGKSTVARIVNEVSRSRGRELVRVKSSDLLRETLSVWSIEETTENLQRLGRAMRDAFGLGALPAALEHRLRSASDIVIWDGIRWLGDEALLRQLTPSILVYVTAPAATRYRRVSNRLEKAEEVVGRSTSWEAFLEVEGQENERDVPSIGARADYTVENVYPDEKALELRVREILTAAKTFGG